MTDIDEALKNYARHSADVAGDQDLGDVLLRAERSRRAGGTRVLTAVGVAAAVAAAVAAIASVVFVLSKHDPVAYSSPQPGRSLPGASESVNCSPPGPGGPASPFVASSFSHHCIVRVLALEGLGTISPATTSAPVGSLEAAEALLETAAFYTDAPSVHAGFHGIVGPVLAGYGSVKTDPSLGSVHYDGVDAWVLAWRVEGMTMHCRVSGGSPSYNPGATEEWHFLVFPSDGQPPAFLNSVTERCGELQPATAEAVFRNVRPVVDSGGNYLSYACPQGVGGDIASVTARSDGTAQSVDIMVGVPVGSTRCTPVTKHVAGFVDGKTVVVGPPGELHGWPAGVPRP